MDNDTILFFENLKTNLISISNNYINKYNLMENELFTYNFLDKPLVNEKFDNIENHFKKEMEAFITEALKDKKYFKESLDKINDIKLNIFLEVKKIKLKHIDKVLNISDLS